MYQVKDGNNIFYIGDSPDSSLARIEFRLEGKILTIDHTGVSPDLKGQGVGHQLVRHAVDFARRHGMKVMPLCPYARSQFEKHPEYGDVLLITEW